MEKPGGSSWAWSAVLLLSVAAFSCSTAAEFYRAKEKDMKLDGNLCSLPRTAAFGLGVAALACLSAAQVLATTAVAIRLRRSEGEDKSGRSGQLVADRRRRPAFTIALLVLSWVSFGLVTALLSTGTSMNRGQRYGQGWMDGKCYVVRAGVYLGSAALVALTACLLIVVLLRRPILLVFRGEATMTAPASRHHRRTGPESHELPAK